MIFDGQVIETSIIHIQFKTTVWLLIEYDRCSDGELGRLDEAVGQVVFDASLQCFKLHRS